MSITKDEDGYLNIDVYDSNRNRLGDVELVGDNLGAEEVFEAINDVLVDEDISLTEDQNFNNWIAENVFFVDPSEIANKDLDNKPKIEEISLKDPDTSGTGYFGMKFTPHPDGKTLFDITGIESDKKYNIYKSEGVPYYEIDGIIYYSEDDAVSAANDLLGDDAEDSEIDDLLEESKRYVLSDGYYAIDQESMDDLNFNYIDRVDRFKIENRNLGLEPSALSADEIEALRYYVQGGSDEINRSLREKKEIDSKGRKFLNLIDSAISKSKKLMFGKKLFRGINYSNEKWDEINLKVGDKISDPAYMSTTPDFNVANRFASTKFEYLNANTREADDAAVRVTYEIDLDEGQEALEIDAKFLPPASESEYLLPRNTNFEVTDIRRHARGASVKLKIVTEDDSIDLNQGLPEIQEADQSVRTETRKKALRIKPETNKERANRVFSELRASNIVKETEQVSSDEFGSVSDKAVETSKNSVATVLSQVKEKLSSGGFPNWIINFTTRNRRAPINPISNEEYKSFNLLALQQAGDDKGFRDPRWMTSAEGKKLGATLKPDAEPTSIAVPVLKNYVSDDGQEKEFVAFKTVDVYNAEQFDGVGEYSAPDRQSYTPKEALELVLDRFRNGEKARQRLGIPPIIGERLEAGRETPKYQKTRTGKERIRLPLRSQFKSDEAYLQSLFHELAHSTIGRNRTGRGLEETPEGRAKEEVIAELASAILVNELGLDYDTNNSAEYIRNQALSEGLSDADIADASVKAQAAVDYLLGNDVLPKWEPNQSKNYVTEAQFRNTELAPIYASINPEPSQSAVNSMDLTEDTSVSLNQSAAMDSSQKAAKKVLDGILEKIKGGLKDTPWRRPYKDGFEYTGGSGLPRNPKTKHVYSGVNRFVLSLAGVAAGYDDARWMTYKQAQDMGGQVRKGEKGVSILIPRVVKYDKDKKGNPILDSEGNPTTTKRVYFTAASVFNVKQIDGLDLEDDKATTTDMTPLESQDFIIDRYKKNLEAKGLTAPEISYTYVGEYGNHFGGDSSPNWNPANDQITLPRESQFSSPEEWFETLMHELVHSTGHEDRLDRTDITKNYGTDRSARGLEELIAEMGAASLGEMFGVQYDFENTSAYLQGWQKAISETDFSSFQTASNLAQQAMDYILGIDLGDWSPLEGYNVGKSGTSEKES